MQIEIGRRYRFNRAEAQVERIHKGWVIWLELGLKSRIEGGEDADLDRLFSAPPAPQH